MELMKLPGYRQREKGARIMIEKALRDDTVLNMQQIKYGGQLREELKERLQKSTDADICKVINNIVGWKKDSGSTLEESLDALERLAHIMEEESGFKLPKMVLRVMWMRGLPPKYKNAIENVKTSVVRSKNEMLSRLQVVEQDIHETGRRALVLPKCFNCGKNDYKEKDCWSPKNGNRKNKGSDQENVPKHTRNKQDARNQSKTTARKAVDDERNDSESDGAFLAEHIGARYSDMVQKDKARLVWYSDEWCTDSGATKSCSGNIDNFVYLDIHMALVMHIYRAKIINSSMKMKLSSQRVS